MAVGIWPGVPVDPLEHVSAMPGEPVGQLFGADDRCGSRECQNAQKNHQR